jgi:hypothetical protein
MIVIRGRIKPTQLLITDVRARFELDAGDRLGVQQLLHRAQAPRMFGIAQLEVQILEDISDSLLHPTGQKEQIDFRVMTKYKLVIKP